MKERLLICYKAARAPFLVVSLLPALLGGAMAAVNSSLHMGIFIASVIGVVMAHSTADFIDDYFDYKRATWGTRKSNSMTALLLTRRSR
ncbi:MAG: hypothetical protein GX577_06090 [Leptolinea sp.]|nr:hypothetical protein [Leptolinea sp.]